MDFFELWSRLDEMSLSDLWQKAVDAWPDTAMRQHAIDSVVIKKLVWVPYKGMKTLFVKGLAWNEDKKSENRPVVVFKGVEYIDAAMTQDAMDAGIKVVPLKTGLGAEDRVYFKPLSEEKTDVMVMCSCQDYKWRMHWWNWKNKVHFGSKPKPYKPTSGKPPVNPEKSPGMCKHCMKLAVVLRKCGLYA